MLPVYFPYTIIDDREMRALGCFFSRVAVYQVMEAAVPEKMRKWREEQRLDIRLPMQHHEKDLTAIVRDYQTWGGQHHGGDLSFFKGKGDAVPFFNDTSVAQIRSNIRGKCETDTKDGENGDDDLYPAVFLQLAQNLDEKNREIADDLDSQARNERALMKALKGDQLVETFAVSGPSVSSDDSFIYMIPERIAAWTHLMAADRMRTPLLLTTQQGVLDELMERVSATGRKAFFLQTVTAPPDEDGSLTSFQKALMAYIEDFATLSLAHDEKPPAFAYDAKPGDQATRLSLHGFPGIGPHELLGGDLEDGAAGIPGNTLVGVITY